MSDESQEARAFIRHYILEYLATSPVINSSQRLMIIWFLDTFDKTITWAEVIALKDVLKTKEHVVDCSDLLETIQLEFFFWRN